MFTYYYDAYQRAADSENDEIVQKYLIALTNLQDTVNANANLSFSSNFQVSFNILERLLKKPETYNINSHIFLAMDSKVDFYIASKPLLSKTKKLYNTIVSEQNKNKLGVLQVSTFQEIFETYIGLELKDIAYNSKSFDFYITEEGKNEWDTIERVTPQTTGAEYFGFKDKKDLLRKSEMIKYYGLTKYGKRKVIENIEIIPDNQIELIVNFEPSYVEFVKLDQVNRVYERIDELEVQIKPLVFLDSSIIFQLLLQFEANGKAFLPEFSEKISDQYDYVCLPGVLYDLEKIGYAEFVRELLKLINISKLFEIQKFVLNYQEVLNEYGFNNLKIEILSESVYWPFYIQFHTCAAKFLKADTIVIPSDLKGHYLNKRNYDGKFSLFTTSELNPSYLHIRTAKKFWRKIKTAKLKNESGNLKKFVVSSNFKEWVVPNCLGEILKDHDQKMIQQINDFWLSIISISGSQEDNEKYFNDFREFIEIFEVNENLLKIIPQFSSMIDKDMNFRSFFSSITDYTHKIKLFFKTLIEVNANQSFINSNELFSLVYLFKSHVSNFLMDKFFIKAKFKSPELPTKINFDLFKSQVERNSVIFTRNPSNPIQQVKLKKNILQFKPQLQYNDEFISYIFKQFLLTHYCFHKDELEIVYSDFIKFMSHTFHINPIN